MDSMLHSPAETLTLGREIAANLQPGSVLALVGDLGAGKTCLVQGILTGLGATEPVASPTFTIVHEYLTGRIPVYHFDLYRLRHPAELLDLGWDDYLDRPGIVIVEWADKFPDLLPPGAVCWEIRHEGGDCRSIRSLPPP